MNDRFGRHDFAVAWTAFVLGLVLFAIGYAVFGANNLYEMCHYADIAQNWLDGDGYSTRVVEPGLLAVYEEHGVPPRFPYPVNFRFPLYAALVTASVGLFGFNDLALALVNGLLHALIAAAVYVFGRRLAGREAAALAAILFAIHPVFGLRYSISGFAGSAFALVLLALHVILVREKEWSAKTAAAAGALIGLAYLARFNVILFAPVYLAFIWWRGKWKAVGVASVAGIAAASPILIYNAVHFGGIGSYSMGAFNVAAIAVTGKMDPWRFYRTFDLFEMLTTHGGAIFHKGTLYFFGEFVRRIPSIWDLTPAMLFFAVGLFQSKGALRRFAFLSAGLLLLQGAAFSFLRLELNMDNEYYRGRYFFWFAPALLLVGSRGFLNVVDGFKNRRLLTIGFVALVVAAAAVPSAWDGYHFDPGTDPARAALEPLDRDDTLLVSNMAYQATAYYRLNAIELPADFDELMKIGAAYPVTHLYLDKRYTLPGRWKALFTERAVQDDFSRATGFQPVSVVENGSGVVGVLLER